MPATRRPSAHFGAPDLLAAYLSCPDPPPLAHPSVYNALFVPNLLIDFIFCMDIVKNFFTGYSE